MIAIDACVLANAIGDDGVDGKLARNELRAAGDIVAPDLVNVETVAVLRKRWLAKTITQRRLACAIEDLESIDIDRYPILPLMRRAYELRSKMTPSDATYVALAEILNCELLTSDRRLAQVSGPLCRIRVL